MTAKVVKPRVKFVRELYIMREKKPTHNVLTIASNNQREHTYNLSIKRAIKAHGNIAVQSSVYRMLELVEEICLSPYIKENTIRTLYNRIAIVRSNMHVAVDVNRVIDVQIR